MNTTVKYPGIKVRLTGKDGNAMILINTVARALRKGGVSQLEVDEFVAEAMSGDYDHLLQTCMRWVNVS